MRHGGAPAYDIVNDVKDQVGGHPPMGSQHPRHCRCLVGVVGGEGSEGRFPQWSRVTSRCCQSRIATAPPLEVRLISVRGLILRARHAKNHHVFRGVSYFPYIFDILL